MHANMRIYLRIVYQTNRVCRLDKLSGISGYLYRKTLASVQCDGIGDLWVSDSRRVSDEMVTLLRLINSTVSCLIVQSMVHVENHEKVCADTRVCSDT